MMCYVPCLSEITEFDSLSFLSSFFKQAWIVVNPYNSRRGIATKIATNRSIFFRFVLSACRNNVKILDMRLCHSHRS